MRLETIAGIVGAPTAAGLPELEIEDLAYDSRKVTPGSLFICIQGDHFDGHGFAAKAAEAGAVALICERPTGTGLPELVVPDARAAMSRLAAPFFGHPSATLRTAGVTGTNGKTTVAFLLESIFRAAGDASGMIGTVETRVAGRSRPASRTTPESVDIQKLLAEMVEAGTKMCVLEVTSIGIDSGRVEGTEFDVAVFTNLTHDHLDYHGGMESYFDSKKKLFTEFGPGAAVVNNDDPYGRRLAEQIDVPMTTYGLNPGAGLRAENIEFSPQGALFRAVGKGIDQPVKVALSGKFNVSNALAALGAAGAMGIDAATSAAGIEALRFVPGRFEPVNEGQDFMVFVDYAHTPDGLENVLKAAHEIGGNRVISVFGCGGDRDRAKRPVMGRAAASYSEVAFVTSDNPRTEDPMDIIAEIEEGMRSNPPEGGYRVIEDREEAIRAALAEARRNDVVVIAGKGHESGQEQNGVLTPFDDREVAARLLRGLA